MFSIKIMWSVLGEDREKLTNGSGNQHKQTAILAIEQAQKYTKARILKTWVVKLPYRYFRVGIFKKWLSVLICNLIN